MDNKDVLILKSIMAFELLSCIMTEGEEEAIKWLTHIVVKRKTKHETHHYGEVTVYHTIDGSCLEYSPTFSIIKEW